MPFGKRVGSSEVAVVVVDESVLALTDYDAQRSAFGFLWRARSKRQRLSLTSTSTTFRRWRWLWFRSWPGRGAGGGVTETVQVSASRRSLLTSVTQVSQQLHA